MSEKRFTKEHEWVELDGNTAVIGITDHAQEQLGDVVFVELPALSAVVEKDKQMAVVESVKAASEVYAPLSGTVIELNAALSASPELVNSAPEGEGWFVKITPSNPDEFASLMTKEEYDTFVKESH
ncbi:MAG: glycine cleavage system protein GcvH [Alphaproteobacteria bacterium]|nr:glycine cleavage system protein GcvH [Alphaproteobacteria bacterium]